MNEKLRNLIAEAIGGNKIIVTWSELQSWETRLEHTNREDVGVYCALGRDKDSNLRIYIGKATRDDKFGIRMSAHETSHQKGEDEFLEEITKNPRIMYGVLTSPDVDLSRKDTMSAYIEDVEKCLIHYFDKHKEHCTIVNDTKYTNSTYNHKFMLINKSNYTLLPELLLVKNPR